MFTKIDKILKEKENNKIIFSAFVCKIAETVFKQIFGEKYLFQFIFSNGNLIIKINNSSLASEINLKKNDLIDKINQKLGKKRVTNIKTKIK
jgi:hypothetical protein